MSNYYQSLNCGYEATQEQIKANYRELVQKHHPDKHGGDVEQTKITQKITEAYNTLKTEFNRTGYDIKNITDLVQNKEYEEACKWAKSMVIRYPDKVDYIERYTDCCIDYILEMLDQKSPKAEQLIDDFFANKYISQQAKDQVRKNIDKIATAKQTHNSNEGYSTTADNSYNSSNNSTYSASPNSSQPQSDIDFEYYDFSSEDFAYFAKRREELATFIQITDILKQILIGATWVFYGFGQMASFGFIIMEHILNFLGSTGFLGGRMGERVAKSFVIMVNVFPVAINFIQMLLNRICIVGVELIDRWVYSKLYK